MKKSPKMVAWILGSLSLMLAGSWARAEAPEGKTPETGQQAIAFTADTMDGKTVDFPKAYKGKLVILDFWATWCPPCMGELPGLVKAYQEFHKQGVEVLGVSLDQANAEDKIKTVMGEKKMTWQQIYDGKFWQSRIAEMYVIHSIPHAFLVDGDTGKIIADGESLRGDKLAATLAAAVKEKKASKK